MNTKNKSKHVIKVVLIVLFLIGLMLCICRTSSIINSADVYLRNYITGEEKIGVISQVVTAIICSITSLIGIAFSVQDSKVYGIEIKELNELRSSSVGYRELVFYPMLLLLINIVAYALEWTLVQAYISLLAIVFLLIVIWIDIPIIVRNEGACIRVIQKRIVNPEPTDYLNRKIDCAIENIMLEKNICVAYNLLTRGVLSKSKKEKIAERLLSCQLQIATRVRLIDNKIEKSTTIDNSISNLLEIMHFSFDLAKILNRNIKECVYYPVAILLALGTDREAKQRVKDVIKDNLYLADYCDTEDRKDFVLSIYIRLIIASANDGDFDYLIALNEYYSLCDYSLREKSNATYLFALTSFYLYYLGKVENRVPQELKRRTVEFMHNKRYSMRTRLRTWNSLFFIFVKEFQIDFDKLYGLFNEYSSNMDYYIQESDAHVVLIDTNLVFKWYFTCLLCSYRRNDYDYEQFAKTIDLYYIKQIYQDFHIRNELVVPQYMQDIIAFYDMDERELIGVREFLAQDDRMMENLSKIQKKAIEQRAVEQSDIDKDKCARRCRERIEKSISNEWGFDSDIKITSDRKVFSLLVEAYGDDMEIEKSIIDYFIRNSINEIRINTKRRIVDRKDESFTSVIMDSIMNESITRATENTEFDITYYLEDDKNRKEYQQWIKSIEKVPTRVFYNPTFFTENGFGFNVMVDDFSVKGLTQSQLYSCIDKYRREDGQYVYEGLFYEKEELERILSNKYAIMKMEIRYGIVSGINAISEVEIYPG